MVEQIDHRNDHFRFQFLVRLLINQSLDIQRAVQSRRTVFTQKTEPFIPDEIRQLPDGSELLISAAASVIPGGRIDRG